MMTKLFLNQSMNKETLKNLLWNTLKATNLYEISPINQHRSKKRSLLSSIYEYSLIISSLNHSILLSYFDTINILSLFNEARSSAAKGEGVIFGGGSARIQQSTSMESLIWDNGLSIIANQHANKCQYVFSDEMIRCQSYFETYSQHRLPRINPTDIQSVGETIFKYDITTNIDEINIVNIFSSAIFSWIDGCIKWQYFAMKCQDEYEIECDNCLQVLAERTRYIGCGVSICYDNDNNNNNNNYLIIVCNYYYGTTNINLLINQAFVPYFDPSLNGICSGCQNTDRKSCDIDTGLCYGCPSLNYDVCKYSDYNINCSDYMVVDDKDCDQDGIYSMHPTKQPTIHPTLSPNYNLHKDMDEEYILNQVNAIRSDVTNGKRIFLGNDKNTPLYARNMEKLVWDKALSMIARYSIENICKRDIYLTDNELSNLYKENEDISSVELSENIENIKVGTTRYIIKENKIDWNIVNDIVDEALYEWMMECMTYFNFGVSCDDKINNYTKCKNCLQLIWSKTRYIGCNINICNKNIIFICHYYWSADMENTNWRQPFDFSITKDGICSNCDDTERDICDLKSYLCDGCMHNNYYKCIIIQTFNLQTFGNEGCNLNEIPNICTDGVTPTISPTLSPTNPELTASQIEEILNTANIIRSNIANGQYTNGINTNGIEKWIWNQQLSMTAYCTVSKCNSNKSDPIQLAQRFFDINQNYDTLQLGNDISKINVGETKYIYIIDEYDIFNVDDIIKIALYSWIDECKYYNFQTNKCEYYGNDNIDCSNCLQLLWGFTRYIGCSYNQCSSSQIHIVCHYYYGMGQIGIDYPFLFGRSCDGCKNKPDRNNCDILNNLCYGCPSNNYELCSNSEISKCQFNTPNNTCIQTGITNNIFLQR